MATKFFTLLASVLLPIACSGQKTDNTPVRYFNPDLYLGNWYEIARFNHSFERGIEYATARYTMTDKGTVKVVNSGIKEGKKKTSIGKAKFTKTPGILRVSFFGPFYSDYRVLMVTSDYRYALVGSKSSNYLWILSRTPKVPEYILSSILTEARSRGYDTGKLIWVRQNNGTTLF